VLFDDSEKASKTCHGSLMLRSREAWLAGTFAALLLLASAGATAQSESAVTFSGHIRGPGGVVVPGATVELVNPQTGERKMTWSDDAGNYTLAGVAPGTYKLEVSLLGFRTDVRESVLVTPGRALNVDVKLVLAAPESGEATAASAAGQKAAEGGNLANLPKEVRAHLENSGGAEESTGPNGNGTEGNVRFSSEEVESTQVPQAEAGGEEADLSASAQNSFLLAGGTGISAATPGGGTRRKHERVQKSPEMAAGQSAPGFGGGGGHMVGGPSLEMMAASMGGAGGPGGWAARHAQVNRIHGNFFDSYTNSVLDAHPYPLNVASSPRIPAYTDQGGFNLGGPLVIPKIYNGKNKTSFFVHYSLTRGKNPFDSFATVPTLGERAGDFSEAQITSGPLAGTVPTIYDPLSSASGPRTPFPNNQLPVARLNPAALGLLKYIPLPNLPGQVQNFHLQDSLPIANDRVMGRLGHQISKKDSLNAFYYFNSTRSNSVSSFPELTSNTSTRNQSFSLSETHTFGPGVINTLTGNFNRHRSELLNPFAFQQDIGASLGITGISTNPFDWGLPITQFTNFSALNDTIASLTRNQTVRVFDILVWNHGKHNIRLGGEFRHVQVNTLTDPVARGTFTFSGYTTSDFTARGLPVPNTGFDFADFLLGLPQTTAVRFGASSNYLRTWVYSGYLQDDWRIGSHFTLNVGLRYQYFRPFTERYGHLSDLTLAPGFASAGVVTGLEPGSLTRSLLRGDANNLAPRLGIAYRPWTQHSLVLRAGYGIFYDGSIYSHIFPNMVDQPPFAQAETLITSPREVLTLEKGFPTLGQNILKNTYSVDPNFRTPYAQTWNFSLEDEVARNVILSLGYVGTKGTKLDLLLAPNQYINGSAAGQRGLALQNALAFTYETSGAASIYNGLTVGLRRQFHGGLSFSGNYTYSKSIDDAASVGGAGRTVAQNYLDLAAERGLSSFDVRHRLLINSTYEFPFGNRKRWLSRGGPAARLIGNWQISGVTTIQSGNPFTASVLGNLSNKGGKAAISNLRANATGQPVTLDSSQRTTQKFFNTAAFSLPQPGDFGDAGRNTIPGPGLVNFNMSLDRFFTLSPEKGIRGDFRVSSNNFFNTPNWNGLATVVNGQGFGRITSVRAMRSVTFMLRVRF
jgi:carboxypeptidase family protein/TonB-dependent receptor-like protein